MLAIYMFKNDWLTGSPLHNILSLYWKKKKTTKTQEEFRERRHLHVYDLWLWPWGVTLTHSYFKQASCMIVFTLFRLSFHAQFQCASKTQIFPYTLICDGHFDCDDGSDEQFCSEPCDFEVYHINLNQNLCLTVCLSVCLSFSFSFSPPPSIT